MKRLVVVESPTKARTIRRFLSDDYRVEASMGHVRDLPASAAEIPQKFKKQEWARLGVNVENDFEPLYVVPSDKKKVVKELKSALKGAEALFIATDEDREGESIGWHLLEVLKPDVPVHRMVFHEITEKAIREALDHTRAMDEHLVQAQETRRILDRLVGYSISPLLWKKIAPKLSAGRVQSVAVRLLVMRETERILFIPASYWSIAADLAAEDAPFQAAMTHLGDLRLATGRDFDDNTGKLKAGLEDGRDCLILTEERARSLADTLRTETWSVTKVDERTQSRSPYAPFITSTLQQEASRKLRLSARETMRVAQRLYEQGYITYMRTDSTNLSDEAIQASREAIRSRYGDSYLNPAPRQFANRVRNAQEAHEAIRPAGSNMRTTDELKLHGEEGALYDLIWKRTVASQMADARLRLVTAHIEAGNGDERAVFRANGRTIEFPGFFRAYVEGSDDPDTALEDREQPLPRLREGDTPALRELEPRGHETKPPIRYTDASLIKVLESEGIGRPSTYATIIDTIGRRGYARRRGNQLIPTFTAFATNNLLVEQFERLVDLGFTAEMEQALDDIASGNTKAVPYLQKFYSGADGLESRIENGLDKIDARQVSSIQFPSWGPFVVRVGKYGPYVETERDGERVVASIPDTLDPGDVSEEDLQSLIDDKLKDDVVLGIHPEAEVPMLLRKGPFGYYVQLGDDEEGGKPKRVSLPKNLAPDSVDEDTAIRLLELIKKKENRNKPIRTLGQHPESGEMVDIFDGRYGPYVKHQRVNASIPKGRAPESITMEEALELLAKKAAQKGKGKRKGGRRKKS